MDHPRAPCERQQEEDLHPFIMAALGQKVATDPEHKAYTLLCPQGLGQS